MQFGVSESVSHWSKFRKDHPAVISNGIKYTYHHLNEKINRIATNIVDYYPNSYRISIAIRSKIDLIATIIAISRIKKSVVLININLTNESLKTNIQDTSSDLLIYDKYNESIGNLYSSLNVDTKRLEQLKNKKTKSISENSFSIMPNDEWGILFSSGTTGTPKGIERDHNSIITELLGWCLELSLSKETVFYIGRPIYYTGGLVLALSNFISGGSIIINDYQNDNDFNEIWNDYQNLLDNMSINWSFFIPDQIRAFCSKVKEHNDNMPKSSEKILIMGAPISGNEKLSAYKLLKSDIVESWGNTESLGTITEPEDLFVRPDSIGRPFITDELYILGDNLSELPPYVVGRIAGNEEAGFIKYSNQPMETGRIKKNELIISDDLGYTDNNGFFYIKGRIQDKIVLGNRTFFTSEIESEISNIDSIMDCSIVFKGTSSGEGLCIAIIRSVESSENKTDKDIANLLSEKGIDSYILKAFKEFPRLVSGKVDKVKLSDMFYG